MDIVIIDGDGWQGLYIDGVLVQEDHSIDYGSLLITVVEEGKPINSFNYHHASLEWLDEQGNFPDDIQDVVLERIY